MIAINEKAILRYKAIDQALKKNTALLFDSSTHQINPLTDKAVILGIDEMIQCCDEMYVENGIEGSVKRSWIYKDLEFLKSILGPNAPIETRRVNRKADYYYSSKDFSIWHTEWMRQSSLAYIEHKMGILDLELLSGGEVFSDFRFTLLNQLSDVENVRKILFKDNEPHHGWHRFFSEIYKAILNEQSLSLVYKTFSGEIVETDFMPQIIKEYNRRYFAFGYNSDLAMRNFPLDRIVEIGTSKLKYVVDKRDWSEYFEDLVGVTKIEGTEPVTIKLRLQLPDAQYFYSKPIVDGRIAHEKCENSWDFTFSAYLNRELENALMSYMPNLEVIEPEELRVKMRLRLSEGLMRNSNVQ